MRSYKMDNYKQISSAKWHKFEDVKDGIILIYANGEQWSVPLDPANRHYQAIQEWVKEGNTIEEAD
jgi:hypothetical protein